MASETLTSLLAHATQDPAQPSQAHAHSGTAASPPGRFQAALRVDRYFQALAGRNSAALQACYHPELQLSNPLFRNLHGVQAQALWAMVANTAADLSLQHEVVGSQSEQALVHWWLRYTDPALQRPVALHIDSEFHLADGLIVEQIDCFDLWDWSRQALGSLGHCLGWSDWLQAKLREQALTRLEKWQEIQASAARWAACRAEG